jgi:hypothetical protein
MVCENRHSRALMAVFAAARSAEHSRKNALTHAHCRLDSFGRNRIA